MSYYWLASASALILMANVASAQTVSSGTTIVTQPGVTIVTPSPSQSYSETKTENTVDANGVQTRKTEHVDKSQSYSSGNGALTAETHVRTGSETTIVTPPPPPPPTISTYRSTTTTTTTQP